MGIADIVAAAHAAVSTHTDVTVAVVYGDNSGTGVKKSVQSDIEQGLGGDRGQSAGAVVVKSADIPKPEHGDVLQVGGVRVYVTSSHVDPSGALRTIQYQETRPATDAELWP